MDVVRHLEHVIKKHMCIIMRVRVDIVQVVRMDFHLVQSRRVATVNVVRHLEHVINVVGIVINMHVVAQDTRQEVVRLVIVNIQLVPVQPIIHGVEVHVYVIVVSNTLVAEPVIHPEVERHVAENTRVVIVQAGMNGMVVLVC